MTPLRAYHAIGVLLAGVTLLATSPALALGFGAYFEYARGIGQIDVGSFNLDRDSNVYAGGFALDTNVSRDSLFNYRLNLGYEYTSRPDQLVPSLLGLGSSQNGVSLNNMFGFGVYRSEHMRAWLGPSIRLDVGVHSDTPLGIDIRVSIHIEGAHVDLPNPTGVLEIGAKTDGKGRARSEQGDAGEHDADSVTGAKRAHGSLLVRHGER
jgi:hypothetical protein